MPHLIKDNKEGEEMKITLEWLKEKNACPEAVLVFEKHFGSEADYQDVLNILGQENKSYWATWLMTQVGIINTTMEIQGDLICENSFFFQ